MSPFRGRPGAAAGPGRFGGRSTLLQGDTAPVVLSVAASNGRTAGGLAVTIVGNNFVYASDGSAPLVTFDGVAATSVVVVDANTITCVTPAVPDTGAVDVVVTVGTQSGTLAGGFTYFSGTIVSLSPVYGSIAGATTILINGYNFVNGSTITFGGSAGTNVIFIDTEHFKVTTPNHALGFVDVVITEPGGAQVTFRNGFQYTLLTRGNDIRRQPGINIRDSLSNPNTCSFVIDGDSNAPQIGEQIQIIDSFDSDRLLFSGSVLTVDLDYGDGSGDGEPDELFWTVTCQDPTWGLNKFRPFGVYRNVSASYIVIDLITRYASSYTTTHVQTNLAKVSVIYDGTQDLFTCLKNLAKAIGGGHVKVDYASDVHFFHVVPATLAPPISQFAIDTTHLTVAEAGAIPAVFSYEQGFYFFRHTFVYSDGSESSLGAISNVLQVTGTNQLSFTGIPLGTNKGTLTCVARRIYVNRFTTPIAGHFSEFQSIESVRQFVQINDNVTTAFTTWYGTTGASTAVVIAIPTSATIPAKTFNGHPLAPASAPAITANLITGVAGIFAGGWTQFKVAFLYRDGSVSLASAPSNSAGIHQMVQGSGVAGYNVTGIPLGPTINGVDVVARFLYYDQGLLSDPNFSSRDPALLNIGFVWPIPFNEPNWVPDGPGALIVVADNVTTALSGVALAYLGTPINSSGLLTGQLPSLVGNGNFPYGSGTVLSVDPIPIWPNPDGPNLEDLDPPGDLTNANPDLLRDPAFRVSADITQIRNRIYVVGSGSVAVQTAAVGATSILVGDISNFSPSGGKVRIVDIGTGAHTLIGYSGLAGTPGSASISLSSALTINVSQGALINNFFQADDFDSQKFLSKIELDKNGNPTDGIHEFTIVDASLKATFQLYMRAYAELELWSKPIVSISYGTRDSKSKAGQNVHADMTNPPCQGDFLIQDVTIDQVHDESDNLSPRYNVSASSVRFELDDLLLQILQSSDALGGSVSAAGLVQSAVASVPVASSSSSGPIDISQLMRAVSLCSIYESSGSGNLQALIGLAPSVSGAASATFIDSRGVWSRLTSAATVGGTAAAVTSTAPTVRLDHNPTLLFHFRLNAITNVRVWIGFWSNNPTDADVSVRAGCGVRFSTVAGDTGFRLVAYDGSTQTLGGTLGTFNANTEYLMRVAVSGGGTLLTVTIVDVVAGTQVSGSLAIPVGATGQALFFGVIRVMPQTTSALILDVLRWATEYGEAVVPITV